MNRIKILRAEYRDTQKDLADYLGVDFKRITNWERGKSEPSIDLIKRIADRYGVSTDYLMGHTDSRELPLPEPIRLLKEYLEARMGGECPKVDLIKLDQIIHEIVLFASK